MKEIPTTTKKGTIAKAVSVLLLAVAFAPIVSLPGVPYPSISGKTFFLRLILAVISVLIAYLSFRDAAYRASLVARIKALWARPVVKASAVSYVLLVASTIFAFDRFTALYSSVERSEGLVGLTFFYAIFFCMGVVFEEREWNLFFNLTLIAGWIVLLVEFFEALGGTSRPDSLVDNPIYLAGYLLFVIFAGCMVWLRGKREKDSTLRIHGMAAIIASLVGILVSQTRGAMAGVVVGFVAMLVYLASTGGSIKVGRSTARKISGWILLVFVVCGGVFAATRHAALWQDIPGVDRIASFSFKDETTVSRGINAEIAIKSVEPSVVGAKRMLLGWGWDNYTYAWERFYDPHLYAFDTARFDRPHDKLLDMLSMTGVLGLLAFLALWFLLLRAIVRIGRAAPLEGAALLFWAVAFFVQDLTAFDTVITFVTFFTLLAYVSYRTLPAAVAGNGEKEAEPAGLATPIVLSVVALAFLWAFVADTLIPHIQMLTFRTELTETWSVGNDSLLSNSIFAPDTYAQDTIRTDLLDAAFTAYNNGQLNAPSPFLDRGISEMESYTAMHPDLYDDQLVLAKGYDVQAALHDNDLLDYKLAETHYLAALALIPNRQTVIYPYSVNLARQGRMDDAVALLKGAIARDPEILQTHFILGEVYALGGPSYSKDALPEFETALDAGIDLNEALVIQAYQNFLFDFKQQNDPTDFRTAAVRLGELQPELQATMQQLVASLDATHVIPELNKQ